VGLSACGYQDLYSTFQLLAFETFNTLAIEPQTIATMAPSNPTTARGFTTTVTVNVAAATKAASESVDVSDWSFRNWPAFVWHTVKITLYLVSAIAVVALGYALIVLVVFILTTVGAGVVGHFQGKGKKGEQAAPSNEGQGEGIPMNDREVGQEEGVQQPLMATEHEDHGNEDADEELPPKYDGMWSPAEG